MDAQAGRLKFKGVTMKTMLRALVLSFALVLSQGVLAKEGQPHEALNPQKAQSLPLSPLIIASGDAQHAFTVELADDDGKRTIGLMHRAEMAADRGMLFDFHTPRRVGFWMRNTFIPLDMIFARSNGEIVSIIENVQPHTEKPVGPDRPVRAVLELNAGTVKKLGLKIGDMIHHAAFKNALE